MIALNRRTRVYLCREPTDLRSSYDSLIDRVRGLLSQDPFSGHCFVFVNKSRSALKALYYDGTGFVLVCKRLERGYLFSRPNPHLPGNIELTQAEFHLFFEGADLEKRFIESPKEFQRKNFLRKFQKTAENRLAN